ncbi:hypothetical protein YM18_2493 [Geobacter sulfurreducens]|nr:hypothetical protein YM18_2493 [Geobacter sulfurreducens]
MSTVGAGRHEIIMATACSVMGGLSPSAVVRHCATRELLITTQQREEPMPLPLLCY